MGLCGGLVNRVIYIYIHSMAIAHPPVNLMMLSRLFGGVQSYFIVRDMVYQVASAAFVLVSRNFITNYYVLTNYRSGISAR